jgi:hypothetical protein
MTDERTDSARDASPATLSEEMEEPIEGVDGGQADDVDETTDAISGIDPAAAEALREEWGADFEANLALAREAAGAVADDALVELLDESGLGNDPRIIRAAARIGRLLQAGQGHRGGSPSADERDALEENLDELSRRPDYWTDRVQRRVRQIHLALHGDR